VQSLLQRLPAVHRSQVVLRLSSLFDDCVAGKRKADEGEREREQSEKSLRHHLNEAFCLYNKVSGELNEAYEELEEAYKPLHSLRT
jgi:hypothetical protein